MTTREFSITTTPEETRGGFVYIIGGWYTPEGKGDAMIWLRNIREDIATGRIALGWRRLEHGAKVGDDIRVAVVVGGSEPPGEHGLRDRFHAVRAHGGGAVDPALSGGERGSGATERETPYPLRCVDGEPHPFDSAEREAAERDLLEVERVEKLEQISAEIVDRRRTGRNGRAPVAAPVVADDPEARCELRDLRLPHRERRPEGAREDERRRIRRAVDGVVELHTSSAVS